MASEPFVNGVKMKRQLDLDNQDCLEGQKYAYGVALAVMRTYPFPDGIDFLQSRLDQCEDLTVFEERKRPVKWCRCDSKEGDSPECELHKTEIIEPLHCPLF